ncbi:hypothetical protein T11_15912 [Trichinella zimbabwensis]|uniref:Uncharacterized protein n=1 Tax=Trichinella zimbabwensis TaxID=268475 RepID=A0A0V1H8M5_9BILA|nr:hypothetical protein T11_15912 [Trichinella zimbabwensis]
MTRMSTEHKDLDISTSAMSVKFLTFRPHTPWLWFAQAEAQFQLRITTLFRPYRIRLLLMSRT